MTRRVVNPDRMGEDCRGVERAQCSLASPNPRARMAMSTTDELLHANEAYAEGFVFDVATGKLDEVT